uniref:chemokine XC receptor 1-like n=1 Tax=Scatophagus argus TaxID=75038 RepID=UPI001ED7F3A8|nr:chemokine XC receptor 1-like [Scatophagus argus]XP_046265342.1 chemokine XC receptor 1-like [Scatophagus argus]
MSDGGMDTGGHVEYLCEAFFDFETISGSIFILIFLFSVTGNTLLLCVLVFYEDLKNVTNIFILNLACSDLVFTVTLPFWAVYQMHHWIFGEIACKLLTAAYIVGLYSSTILLTAMTVDRFITVVLYSWPNNPAKRQMCAIAACVAAWVISIAASVSDAIKVKVETQWDVSVCEDPSDGSDVNLGYYLQVSLLFFVPFVIIVFCYAAILKTALQTSNKKRRRTIMVVFCIVTAFFISWGPFNIVLLIQSLYEPVGCYAKETLYVAYSVCRILAFSHCCMNPLLYMLSQKFRKHLLLLLRCKNFKRKNENRGTGQCTGANQNVAFCAQNSAVLLEAPAK